ncbi:MAG TPA: BON domain-containing protein [Pirellulales bacterium]|nr:BON domain-containing protein [Pirellulales bacterium]
MSPRYNRLVTAAYDQNHHPDQTVARRAEERLRGSTFVAIRRLTCDVHEGMLTVRGRVPNFYTKQVALSLLSSVPGVEEITDRVEVA